MISRGCYPQLTAAAAAAPPLPLPSTPSDLLGPGRAIGLLGLSARAAAGSCNGLLAALAGGRPDRCDDVTRTAVPGCAKSRMGCPGFRSPDPGPWRAGRLRNDDAADRLGPALSVLAGR